MDVFNYHPITGEYLGVGAADENPLDPDDPIIAGFATPTAPPVTPDGMVAVYRSASGLPPQNWPEGSWVLERDYRNVPLYRTEDGAPYAFDGDFLGIGELPSTLTEIPRPSVAHVWEDGAWRLDEALEAERLAAEGTARRDALLAEADARIAPLMDGFVLGELSDAEGAQLRALSQYRKALRALDLSDPRAIHWPEVPA